MVACSPSPQQTGCQLSDAACAAEYLQRHIPTAQLAWTFHNWLVHATGAVIAALKTHLFNRVLWPDLSGIPDHADPLMRWQPLECGTKIELHGRCIASHPVITLLTPSLALRSGAVTFLFTGDMALTPSLWAEFADERAPDNVKMIRQ